jgi:predicted XRE-type DNA-binding protein
MMTDIAEEHLIRSTGNVFADLDLGDPRELAIKSILLSALQGVIDGPAPAEAGTIRRGLQDDEVQAIADGDPGAWTIDGLVSLLDRLGLRVAVRVVDETGTPRLEREIVPAATFAGPTPGR